MAYIFWAVQVQELALDTWTYHNPRCWKGFFGAFLFLFSPPACRRCSQMATVTVQRCRRQGKKTETETFAFVCTMSESFSFPQVSTVYWSLPFLPPPLPPDERSHTRIHAASFSAGASRRHRSLLRVTYVREETKLPPALATRTSEFSC